MEADSHSYQDRLEVNLIHGNRDFDRFRGASLARYFQEGLVVEATQIDSIARPRLTLAVHPKDGARLARGRDREVAFTAFDGSGGLLLGRMDGEADLLSLQDLRQLDQKRRLEADALAELNAALAESESAILCIPLAQSITQEQTEAIAQRIHELRKRTQLQRLVVCFTMYEKLGRDMGRAAYRNLANRGAARRAMAAALGGSRNGILKALRLFDRHRRRGVWCVPVSTYGFVPGNGGINYDPQARTLLPRTPRGERVAPTVAAPYAFQDAWSHWQPFCTIDPFVFIATGDREGTLIHTLDELGL